MEKQWEKQFDLFRDHPMGLESFGLIHVQPSRIYGNLGCPLPRRALHFTPLSNSLNPKRAVLIHTLLHLLHGQWFGRLLGEGPSLTMDAQ